MSMRAGMITLRFRDCRRRHLRCVSELTHREGNFSRSRGPESSGIDGKNGDAQTSTYRFNLSDFHADRWQLLLLLGGDFGPSPFWQHVNVILTSAQGNVKGKRRTFRFGSIATFIYYLPHSGPPVGPAMKQAMVAAQTCVGKTSTHICFGSQADIRAAKCHARFTPESGH